MNGEPEMLITQVAPAIETVLKIGAAILAITAVIIVLAILGEGWRRAVKDLGQRAAGPIRTVADRVAVAMRATWSTAASAAAHFVPPLTEPAQIPGAVVVALATSLIYLGLFVLALGGEVPSNAARYAALLRRLSSLDDQSVGDLAALSLSSLAVLYGLLAFETLGWTPGTGPWNRAGRWGRIVLSTLAWLGLFGSILALVILNVFAQVRLEYRVNLPALSVLYSGLFQGLLAFGTALTGFCLIWLGGLLVAGAVALLAGLIGLLATAIRLFATCILVLGCLVEQTVEQLTRLADHFYHHILLETPLADWLKPIVPRRPG